MAHLTWILGAVGGVLGIIYLAADPAAWLAGLGLIAVGASGVLAGVNSLRR